MYFVLRRTGIIGDAEVQLVLKVRSSTAVMLDCVECVVPGAMSKHG